MTESGSRKPKTTQQQKSTRLQQKVETEAVSCSVVSDSAIPCTVARQAPLSIEFSTRILEWVAISFSRDLPDPGIELGSPALQADSLLSEPPGKPNRKLKLARGKKKNKKQTSKVWSMKKCCRLVATFGNNNGNLCANGYLKVSRQA